jgi:uncharacterized protein YdhG (YjbR/CyaY superfamily)
MAKSNKVISEQIAEIETYIDSFPSPTKELLIEMRSIIQKLLPTSKEVIRYGLPTFYDERNIVHFGGAKNHVALYPGPEAIIHFKSQLKSYVTTKGSIHFPLNKSLPRSIIEEIVTYLSLNHYK